MKIVSWNIGHRSKLWEDVIESGADLMLLQEACEPPSELRPRLHLDDTPWITPGAGRRAWRTAVVGLNRDLTIDHIPTRAVVDERPGDLVVSRPGTLAAAHVYNPTTEERITVVSMYALWEKTHLSAKSSWIYADASAHRLISDISALVGRENDHSIIAAGDLNILYGHGENGNRYWAARYKTIFDRFVAIGLRFVGPQHPDGRLAVPWPSELPSDSKNVPTFHTSRQDPLTATRQLDFVFASNSLEQRVKVRALNEPEAWGESDHCRLEIAVVPK